MHRTIPGTLQHHCRTIPQLMHRSIPRIKTGHIPFEFFVPLCCVHLPVAGRRGVMAYLLVNSAWDGAGRIAEHICSAFHVGCRASLVNKCSITQIMASPLIGGSTGSLTRWEAANRVLALWTNEMPCRRSEYGDHCCRMLQALGTIGDALLLCNFLRLLAFYCQCRNLSQLIAPLVAAVEAVGGCMVQCVVEKIIYIIARWNGSVGIGWYGDSSSTTFSWFLLQRLPS